MADKTGIYLDRVTRWHRYGKMTAGRICLQVADGEHVLIFGQNRGELSDLFHIAAGLSLPDEGAVRVHGSKAVILEEFPHMETLTVKDYILLPAQLEGMPGKLAAVRAERLLAQSPLKEKMSVKVQFLSCFERCLLWLDMAAMTAPEVLIMGDCTQELNDGEEKSFWDYAGDYIDRYKITLLCFCGHPDIPYMFHRKYILKNSQIKLLSEE